MLTNLGVLAPGTAALGAQTLRAGGPRVAGWRAGLRGGHRQGLEPSPASAVRRVREPLTVIITGAVVTVNVLQAGRALAWYEGVKVGASFVF